MTTGIPHPSDSAAQREAEGFVLKELARRLGAPIGPARLDLEPGTRVELDGFAEGPPAVAAEIFVHQGKLKGGQKHKILADVVKLLAVRTVRRPNARLLIVLTDEDAAAGVRGGWRHVALEALGVEVMIVPLPDEVRARVVAAQTRQKMTNAT